ncbi:hypothetical protein MA20_42010 [Bradyrhizobium japonicum]|uniref:Uncharacterized protein n=1 Tax=Bradyrhizobium japonicum TaxID=375 RepID=A0A0A3XKT1_BRAJP|nr:hypothetical protein [Bradyrhizobium japonicum]KGT73781.1 hypothetical protein MA20_42010 [Bradyrhizobium japonicum]
MSGLKLLSTALITVAMLAAPALARENHMTSRHFTESADANTTIGVGHNDWRPCYGNRASELCGYGDRDVWSHWGGYYGPMVHAP